MSFGLVQAAIGEAGALFMVWYVVRNRWWRRAPLCTVFTCQCSALFAAALVFQSRGHIGAPALLLGWVLVVMVVVTSLTVERAAPIAPGDARLWKWLGLSLGVVSLLGIAVSEPTQRTGWDPLTWAMAIEGLTLFGYFSLCPGGPG